MKSLPISHDCGAQAPSATCPVFFVGPSLDDPFDLAAQGVFVRRTFRDDDRTFRARTACPPRTAMRAPGIPAGTASEVAA